MLQNNITELCINEVLSILSLPGRENQPIDMQYWDAFLFHTPFCKLVQKSLARLMLNDFVRTPEKERSKKFPGLEHMGYVKQGQ